MKITEQDIERHMKCPMLDREVVDPLAATLDFLFRWAVLTRFNGRIVSLNLLHWRFESRWKHVVVLENLSEDAMWDGYRAGNRAAAKIVGFLEAFQIMKPVEAYTLELAGHSVEGEYAVIQRCGNAKPMVLMFHTQPTVAREEPDPIEMVRYLHLMMDSDFTDVGIYHLPLRRGKVFRHTGFNLPLVRQGVMSILGSFENVSHPRAGAHCQTCVGKKCWSIVDETEG